MQHASWLFIAVISIRQTSEKQPTYNQVVLMAILPTDIRILFTNYNIITYCLYPHSPKGEGIYCFTSVRLSFRPSKIFFVAFFSVTVDGRSLIFGHKRHIDIPYCGQRFWTRQIPTSCLPTQLIFIHIEHMCTFFVSFFSATIDGRNLIFGQKLHIGAPYHGKRFWTHQIPTSCLPILLIFIHI